MPLPEILSALADLAPLPGRLRPVPGLNGALLLDDSYDAERACTLAALDALADHYPDRRRIAVLGGVRYLGRTEQAEKEIGARAAQRADVLVLKGERGPVDPRRRPRHRAARTSDGSVPAPFVTYTNQEAARYLAEQLTENDVVLIKGAREERMEEITRALMHDPATAPEQLVRQEPAFQHVHLALPERPTWLQVDLGAIADNLRRVRQHRRPRGRRDGRAQGRRLWPRRGPHRAHGDQQWRAYAGRGLPQRRRALAPVRDRGPDPGAGLHAGLAGAPGGAARRHGHRL